MKRLKIVCILMAILLLAGCTAPPGATETLSREEQETGHIALMGLPAESEPSSQLSKEPSQEPFEDTASVEETPSYEWDFQKGWSLYVLSEEDWETLTHQCYPDVVRAIGTPMFWKAVNDFPKEELLFEVCIGSVALSGDPEQFFRSLGIPYKILEHDLYPQQIYLLNLSVSDCFQVVKLMHRAGLVWAEDAMIFEIYRHGEPLLDVETVSDIPKNEFPMPENPSYNWEFHKDLPLFVFRPEDEELYWDFPDVCFPYGQARWYCLTTAFDVLGEEMLYHVTMREPMAEQGDGTFVIDPENTPVGDFLEYFGIPYEIAESGYHLNLSYRDAVTLVGLMHKAGLVESETAGVFDFCYCGDLCGATHTVSPALPNWTDILIHVRNL